MAFLQFLFVLFVVVLAVGAYVIWRVYRALHQAARQFGGQRRATERRTDSSSRRTTTTSGDVIIDHRSPEKSQQKIFKKGEGEYVEFEEE